MASQYKVVLKAIGNSKINVIKAVREITPSLGLQEAKALVESLGTVAEGVNAELAAEYKAQLEAAGAMVGVVPCDTAAQFKVVLKATGGSKINVIKAVRDITPGLGLQEAKALVESLGTVADGIDAEAAAEYKAKLEAAGATVEIVAMAEPGAGPAKPARDLAISELTSQITGLSAEIIARLADEKGTKTPEGIKSLADIRRNGGVPEVQGLSPEDRSKLEAHAYLSLVSDEPEDSRKLIDAGMAGIAEIATMSGSRFVQKAKTVDVAEEKAKVIHAKAWAANAFMTNVVTEARAGLANDLRAKDVFGLDDLFPRQGGYDERVSAVSPAAYLADLLDYVCTSSSSKYDFAVSRGVDRLEAGSP